MVEDKAEQEFEDSCYGRPCFKLGEIPDCGYCTKLGYHILISQAKTEKLCDFESPEQQPDKPKKSVKVKAKKR